MEITELQSRLGIVPRVLRRLTAACRRLTFGFRRLRIHLTQPCVRVGRGACLGAGVELKATDGGVIIIGSNCSILRGVSLIAKGARLEIGDSTFIGPWSTIVAISGVAMGRDCLVAERVTIRDQDHAVHMDVSIAIARSGMVSAPIVIGDGVWLAAGAVLLKGVQVGTGAVVAANAVVTRNVPALAIVGGVPAAIIGRRVTPSE